MPRATLIVALIVVAALAQGCTRPGEIASGVPSVVAPVGPMIAEARVVSQPRGGTNVTELSCTVEMTEIPGDGADPIAVQVDWVAPCGTHGTEVFLFHGGSQAFESSYSEGGYPIGMTFWAVITWHDALGSHRIQTDVAVCSVR